MATILVVDDDGMVGRMMSCVLEDAGYTVLTATSASEGLVLAHAHVPDLVVSDVMMPRMDGGEFARRLWQDARLTHLPVVLMSAGAVPDLDGGSAGFAAKPFLPAQLLAAVRSQLDAGAA